MSIFGQQIIKDASIEESTEFSGGSSLLPSDVYKAEILQAYMTQVPSQQGGTNYNWNWKLKVTKQDGSTQEMSQNNIFIAKDRGQGIVYYYEKDGKKTEYPAFSALNRHLKTLVGQDLFTAPSEQRTLPVYNFDTKSEVPTQVTVIPALLGQTAVFGIIETHENKRSDETKVVKFNTIEKCWKLVNGQPLTAKEIEAGMTTAADVYVWKEANNGRINDRNLDKSKLEASSSTIKETTPLEIG